jgi:hypothetical protein
MGENVNVLGARFRAIEFIVCLVAMTWACGPRSTPVPATPTQDPPSSAPAVTVTRPEASSPDCALIAEPGESIATVAIGDRIDPSNAPHPSNEGERLLFRQMYETLVRVDCNGQVRPGLAASWRLDGDGRTWIITLRENARFSDGTPVTPSDVRAAWTRDASGNELRPPVSRVVHSIVPRGDRSVAITLRSQRVDAPLALAHTDLAIAKPSVDSPWPLGTRTDRAAPEPHEAGASSVITVRRDTRSPIRFVLGAGDPRDLLDKGVDLLLTRDAAALDYAATLPHFQSVPLEWQRIHVLLTPRRMSVTPSPSEDALQALATDAVRGESRGAVGPFWWQMLQDCEVTDSQPRNQPATTSRIVYDERDAAARDLAERLVGLARDAGPEARALLELLLPDHPGRTNQRAVGLTGEALARARRLGTDAGYILRLERRPLDPCRDIQVVMDSAQWLNPKTIVPLVETRLRAVVRRGRSGVSAEWDGGLVIAGASGPG